LWEIEINISNVLEGYKEGMKYPIICRGTLLKYFNYLSELMSQI